MERRHKSIENTENTSKLRTKKSLPWNVFQASRVERSDVKDKNMVSKRAISWHDIWE